MAWDVDRVRPMATHKAVHVAVRRRQLTLVRRRNHVARQLATSQHGVRLAGSRLRGTDQGFVNVVRLSGHDLAADAGTRDRRDDRRARRRRRAASPSATGLPSAGSAATARQCVPCRKGKFMQCEYRARCRACISGRVRRIGDRACGPRWPASPTGVVRRSCPDGLRRGHAPINALRQTDGGDAATASRSSASDGLGTPRRAVGTGDGFRSRRDRSRRGQGRDAQDLGAHHYIDSTAR